RRGSRPCRRIHIAHRRQQRLGLFLGGEVAHVQAEAFAAFLTLTADEERVALELRRAWMGQRHGRCGSSQIDDEQLGRCGFAVDTDALCTCAHRCETPWKDCFLGNSAVLLPTRGATRPVVLRPRLTTGLPWSLVDQSVCMGRPHVKNFVKDICHLRPAEWQGCDTTSVSRYIRSRQIRETLIRCVRRARPADQRSGWRGDPAAARSCPAPTTAWPKNSPVPGRSPAHAGSRVARRFLHLRQPP